MHTHMKYTCARTKIRGLAVRGLLSLRGVRELPEQHDKAATSIIELNAEPSRTP